MAYRVKLSKEGKGTSRVDFENSAWATNVHRYVQIIVYCYIIVNFNNYLYFY